MDKPGKQRQPLPQLLAKVRKNRVFRAGSIAGAIKALGLLSAFALQLLLARIVINPEQYGIYAWSQNLLFLLGTLMTLGIPVAVSRFVAVHTSRGDGASVAAVARSGARWLVLSTLLVSGTVALVIIAMPAEVFEKLPRETTLIAVASAPLATFSLFYQALARARSRLVTAFLPLQVLRPLSFAALAFTVLVALGEPLAAPEIMLALCMSLALVVFVQIVYATSAKPRRAVTRSAAEATADNTFSPERLLGNALPIFGVRLSDLAMKHGGVLALGVLVDPRAAAAYFVAERLAQLASVPQTVIASVVQPWLASASAEGDQDALQRTVSQAGHATLWPSLVAVIGLLLTGPMLLGLFGPGYLEAFPILAVLLTNHLLAATLGPAQQVLIMSGLQSAVLKTTSLAGVIHLVSLFLLIPWLGALGAALTGIISTMVISTGCLFHVRSRLGLNPTILSKSVTSEKRSQKHDESE
ncbi:lipopolysaccharide biosynthesis protein [Wenzhouxiangella sediminis]|uniref:Uncharacterized protein n=1 Tax=Wenzhouxiangella sediminis TaxID=1792836 RepID=A0A3E1K5E0_9GAMM|nr:oligosaccharide flippase family protein [Wenzhouxiangella sediminis]RFF29241.1 hypothetical protein DZC52_14155 [Wenzhouxiangella sediminis]